MTKIRKYEVLKDYPATGVEAGTVVYELMKCDYGLASDDTRYTGIQHMSVTENPDGDYPSKTIPVSYLREIKLND